MRKIIWALFLFAMMMSWNCTQKIDQEYVNEIDDWHQKRIDRLSSDNGWLSLAGLYWLKEGENSFGSDRSNKIKFPKDKSPDFIGSLILEDGEVRVKINPEMEILCNNKTVSDTIMRNDTEGQPTTLTYGSLSWYIIKRGNKYGIRLKDRESTARKEFDGIERFPVDPEWKINAKLIPYDPPKMILLPTALGTIDTSYASGQLVFEINNKEYTLDPTGEEGANYLFIVFSDFTSGVETYGGGRFLYCDMPDTTAYLTLDFNKAYNPPCAFTEFATCPLPPDQNKIPEEIRAGEKNYGHHP